MMRSDVEVHYGGAMGQLLRIAAQDLALCDRTDRGNADEWPVIARHSY